MLAPLNDIRLTDYLTKYLKHFKATFHHQLTLIQSIATLSQQIPQHIQRVELSRTSAFAEIYDNDAVGQIIITKETWKTIERFFMRINEYVEYRIIKTKNIQNEAVWQEVEKFYKSFQSLVTQMNKDIESGQFSLLSVFSKLSRVEDHYLTKIIEKTAKNSQSISFSPEIFKNIKDMLKNRKSEQLQWNKKEGVQDETRQSESSETSRRKKQVFLFRNSFLKQQRNVKNRGRRATIQSFVKFPEKMQQGQYQNLSICEERGYIRTRAPTENSQKNLNPYSYSSCTGAASQFQTRSNILTQDLLDVETDQRKPNKKNLLKQLQQLNKKNDIAINQFLKRIKKKKQNNNRVIGQILENDPSLKKQFQSEKIEEASDPKYKRTRTFEIDRKTKKIQGDSLRKQIMKLPSIKIKNR